MRSWVTLLTVPTADTPGTTLLLHFDKKRYLIGSAAEGTQRASVQAGGKLLKVAQYFLTGRAEWSNTGGLFGMILTLADSVATSQASSLHEARTRAGKKAEKLGVQWDAEKVRQLVEEETAELRRTQLNIFGPPNLNHTLATARRFVFRKGLPINIHEIDEAVSIKDGDDKWAPYWVDENIKVWAMSILPSTAVSKQTANGTRTLSPRKRSIDEVYEQNTVSNSTTIDAELTPREREQLTVKAVVGEMFNSSWRLDALHETPLSQVNLPAAIFVRDPGTNKIEKYLGPLPGSNPPPPDPELKVLVRRPWPGALVDSLPRTEPRAEAVSYIIRGHEQRGKFNPERAMELKVPKGKLWTKIAAGNNVTNEDGETVTPDMVLGESKQGGGIAIIDLPDASYIDNLISRPEWKSNEIMAGVDAFMWLCGRGVATDPRIHAFMHEFEQFEHVVSSPEYCPNTLALTSAAAATARLRMIDPARYRVPIHNNVPPSAEASMPPLPGKNVHIAEQGQTIELEPSVKWTRDAVPPLTDIAEVEKDVSEDILTEAQSVREAIAATPNASDDSFPGANAEVIALGTGSALPSKYRNVSATLVKVPGWGNILLDCGENTLGQLKRVFSETELQEVLRELKIIFISHMHADHHLGTVSVIKAWYQEVHGGIPAPPLAEDNATPDLSFEHERLAVVSEPAMQHWLQEYSEIEDYGYSRLAPLHISTARLDRREPSCLSWFTHPRVIGSIPLEERAAYAANRTVPASALGLADIQAVSVRHCMGARAVSITLPSGFKVSYSGDCRPSSEFAKIGRGSTVCIHEATFDDELAGDAQAKKHSTTSEALGVAQAMGARTCILTHFSQRYQKLPILEKGGNGVSADAMVLADDDVADADDEAGGPIENDDVADSYPDHTRGENGGRDAFDADNDGNAPAAVKVKVNSNMKVGVAFDYMRVKVGEIGQLEKFVPVLLKLFADEERKSGEKSATLTRENEARIQKKKDRTQSHRKGKKVTNRRW